MQGRKATRDILAEIKTRDEETFTLLCDAARQLNEAGVYKVLFERRVEIDVRKNNTLIDSNTVVMQMAEEGHDNAVAFLIDKFKAKIVDAVEGYARANRVDKVEAYLLEWNVMDRAVRGYAFAGAIDRVNNLLKRGANIGDASYGFARAGNLPALLDLFKREDIKSGAAYSAIEGSAYAGFTDNTEALIHHGAELLDRQVAQEKALMTTLTGKSVNPLKKLLERKIDHVKLLSTCALGAYGTAGCFEDQTKMLRLLASTKDDVIFKHFCVLMHEFKRSYRHAQHELTATQLVEKACALRHAMTEHKMSYDEVLTSGVIHAKQSPRPGLFSLHKSVVAVPTVEMNTQALPDVADAPVIVKVEPTDDVLEEVKAESPRPN